MHFYTTPSKTTVSALLKNASGYSRHPRSVVAYSEEVVHHASYRYGSLSDYQPINYELLGYIFCDSNFYA